jgi:hypothetical protein
MEDADLLISTQESFQVAGMTLAGRRSATNSYNIEDLQKKGPLRWLCKEWLSKVWGQADFVRRPRR